MKFLLKRYFYTSVIILFNWPLSAQEKTKIFFKDVLNESRIDFVHYAPRPRWCEIGPTVQGVATNEGLNLVFQEEKEYWKSGDRLLTMEEFANLHLIKMNSSGAGWLDFDRDGDWDLLQRGPASTG